MISRYLRTLFNDIKKSTDLSKILETIWEKDHVSERMVNFLKDHLISHGGSLVTDKSQDPTFVVSDIISHLLVIFKSKDIISAQDFEKMTYDNFLKSVKRLNNGDKQENPSLYKRIIRSLENIDDNIEETIAKSTDFLSKQDSEFFSNLGKYIKSSKSRDNKRFAKTVNEIQDIQSFTSQIQRLSKTKEENEEWVKSKIKRGTSPKSILKTVPLSNLSQNQENFDNISNIISFFNDEINIVKIQKYFQNFKTGIETIWKNIGQKLSRDSEYVDTYNQVEIENNYFLKTVFSDAKYPKDIFEQLHSDVKDGLVAFTKINVYFIIIIDSYNTNNELNKLVFSTDIIKDFDNDKIKINPFIFQDDFLIHFQWKSTIFPVIKSIASDIQTILKLGALLRIKKIFDDANKKFPDSNKSHLKALLLQTEFKNIQFIINNQDIDQFQVLVDVTESNWDKAQNSIEGEIGTLLNRHHAVTESIKDKDSGLKEEKKIVEKEIQELRHQLKKLEKRIKETEKELDSKEEDIQMNLKQSQGQFIQAMTKVDANYKVLKGNNASLVESNSFKNDSESTKEITDLIKKWSNIVSHNVSSTQKELKTLTITTKDPFTI